MLGQVLRRSIVIRTTIPRAIHMHTTKAPGITHSQYVQMSRFRGYTGLPRAAPGLPRVAAGTQEGPGSNNGDTSDTTKQAEASSLPQVMVTAISGLLRRIVPAILGLACLIAAFVGVSPYVLSHPSGLHAALAVANAAAPVEVDIAAVHAAWGSPLTIEGLKITEKGNPDSNQQTDPSSSAGKAGTDGLLLDAESIRTSATLWQILTTSETDVIVTRPRVNATFNEQGVLRVAQALEDAGLSPAPHDIEQVDQAWDSAHAAAAAQHGGGAARSTSSTASSTRGAEPTVGSDRAAASARVSRPRLQLPSSLQRIAAAVPFSGEVRSGKVHVAMADGTLLAPKEFQDLLGGRVYFEVLRGAQAIEESSADESASASASADSGTGTTPSLVEWAKMKPDVRLPPLTGVLTAPIALRVDSPSLHCVFEGWQTSKQFTYLTQPLQAEMKLSPKMAQMFITRLNPLLGSAVALQDSSRVAVSVTPRGSIWPSNSITLQVQPLKVSVGQGAAVTEALQGLASIDKRLAPSGGVVEVELSGVQAEVREDGKVETRRMDLLAGVKGWNRPVHLVTWGTAHTSAGGRLDMTLALPADTLELMGISGMPPDFGVPLHVTGTVAEPKIEIWKASKQIASLLVKSKARQLAGSNFGVPRWLAEELAAVGGKDGDGTDELQFKIPQQ